MYRDTTSRFLFVLLLLAMAWFAGQVIAPFIAGLTWAAVLVVTFRPFHRRLQRAAAADSGSPRPSSRCSWRPSSSCR
jgi:predicted PurR-regulated permease PerM